MKAKVWGVGINDADYAVSKYEAIQTDERVAKALIERYTNYL